MFLRGMLAGAALALFAASAAAQEHASHEHGKDQHAHGSIQRIEGLGTWTMPVTTAVAEAQEFFDQGLRLAYGFNHQEAARSFEEAMRLDPSCAMCAWGVAYAVSPNINLPMSREAEVRGLAAIRRAQSLAGGASERERDLIAALAKRFGEPAGSARAERDSAYAAAMREVSKRYPADADAQVLFADAMLNLRPWNQWTRQGAPQPGTLEVVEVLERVLRQTGEHAGACHFYVHTVEASPKPERALPCAERLPRLMPGAGHVVHMPAHVYLRVGRYEDAARANIAAVEADRQYFADNDVQPGVYPMFYHPHNLHFLWAAYMTSGQHAKSLGAARALVERVPLDAARETVSLQAFLTAVVLTHARFGDWEATLAEPAPGEGLLYLKGIRHYARGIAHTALGNVLAAAAELDSVRATAAVVPEDMVIISNSARTLLRIAELALAGRIAAASGETGDAVALLRQAIPLEDELTYDEPPPWYQPMRQMLGDVLLASGRYAEAEVAYREDLAWVRENGWSLAGLERALREQGRSAEADAVAKRLKDAWKYADSPPLATLPRTRFRVETLRTGARIHWAESGDPSGPALILLHGYSDSWFSWSQLMPKLPADVRVIAFDMRGHGNSGDVPPDFSTAAFAADVAALMDELGILRATIVGHSLGSMVAQSVAARYPARVDRLVLIGAIPGSRHGALSELKRTIDGMGDSFDDDFIRDFQLSTIATEVPDAFLERAIAESGKLSPAVWRGIAAGWKDADYLQQLSQLQPKTLLIWGDRDAYFTKKDQDAIAAAIPGARLIAYAGIGHAVHWEAPERVAEDLVNFIRQ